MANYSKDSEEISELNEVRDTTRALAPKIRQKIDQKESDGKLPDLPRRFDEILKKCSDKIRLAVLSAPSSTPVNLFEFLETEKLIRANKVSRSVATHLGVAWEKMASLSHRALSIEEEFGQKIPGVDLVFLENGNLRHTQIKTKKDTLTGSQSKRSVDELKIYPNSLFAAAFDLGKGWTFPPLANCGIERLAGKDFWDKLSINYSDVIVSAKKCFLQLEDDLFPLT